MKFRLLRHATAVITIGGLNLLIDPMLNPARAAPPIERTPNQQRNPLVDLPLTESELADLLLSLDGVLVTHTHSDHWDNKAAETLPKSLPVFCQPEDQNRIRAAGFSDVRPVESNLTWGEIRLTPTAGQHGAGELARAMAPVSGFILEKESEPVIYIAGDTVWCPQVAQAIDRYQPDIIVVNAGAAQFTFGDPITMTAEDVIQVAQAKPDATVIAVHMEAINHCLLTRKSLFTALHHAGLNDRVNIPLDGEEIT